ncbi:MAG: UDP-2,3-diacylglucosamine diphosphatase [Bacteroidetes bacterium]|nr:UDP-2,3-diacylglucosamine diphosphatase [Bacteroidota bacterium]
MQIPESKKVYFLSDFHLGIPTASESLIREKKIVSFLEKIRQDAAMIFIVGDLFDFWYEYKKVVPKGHVRILGKMAEITDSGIPIHFFVGNHDMWMKNYFQEELNVPVFFEPQQYHLNQSSFLVGHGDGLGPGDHGYKMLKKIFRNPVCQWLFGILPPAIGMGIAHYFSQTSRAATGIKEDHFLGEEKEWLVQFCKSTLQHQFYDYFIFGHRHLPIDYALTCPNSGRPARYLNLGDWIRYFSYVVFDGKECKLMYEKE